VNNLRGAAVVGAVAFLAGAVWMEFRDAPADKYLFIAGQEARDWASGACRSMVGNPTVTGHDGEIAACMSRPPEDQANAFIQGIGQVMALDPNCAGVTLEYLYPPEGQKHKTLTLYYVPGHDQQTWDMDAAGGRGTPKEIGADVCLAMSGNGARLAP
jgi:hypothetical protein